MRNLSPSIVQPAGAGATAPAGRKTKAPRAPKPPTSPCAEALSPSMLPREPKGGDSHSVRKASKASLQDSPSMPAVAPAVEPAVEPPPLELPPAASGLEGAVLNPGKVPVPAPVPEAPPLATPTSLISEVSGISPEEAYSTDEKQLNNFLKLHPMLSLLRLACGSNSRFARTP